MTAKTTSERLVLLEKEVEHLQKQLDQITASLEDVKKSKNYLLGLSASAAAALALIMDTLFRKG